MRASLSVRFSLFFFLLLQLVLWSGSRYWQAKWDNVPPPPTQRSAAVLALGDSQFAYRVGALMLLNFGTSGGRAVALGDYNLDYVTQWLFVLNDLDPASEMLPYTASYYFGAAQNVEKLRGIIDYLSVVGQVPVAEKWRWLASAARMALHQVGDSDLALDLAYKLAAMKPIGSRLPSWARLYPAFVHEKRGEMEAARVVTWEVLQDPQGWHPNEINFMKYLLVERLGEDPSKVGPYE